MFSQRIALSNQDGRIVSSTKLHKLGTVAETPDGRVFRYARAGAVNLATSKVSTSSAKVTNHTNLTTAANAIGARNYALTLGATATTAGQYDDGYVVVNDSTGAGVAYSIAGTPVIALSTAGTIQLAEPVVVATTTSSKSSLVPNPWADTLVSASAVALFCVGSPNVAVTAANYYWSQTGGIASVLADGIIGKGSGAILSDAVDGALEVEVAGTVTQRIATAVEATVDAKYYPVFLTLE